MEKIVIFQRKVQVFLEELVDILFEKEYFGFKKDAKEYVWEIVQYVDNHDFETGVRNTTDSLQKYGKFYLKYKANNRTTWYIFFDRKNNRFLVNHILNNHSQDFPELI